MSVHPEQILIPESVGSTDPLGLAILTVLRTRNFVGVVTVYWAVSEEGEMDIQPTSGNITFDEVSVIIHIYLYNKSIYIFCYY